MSVVEGISLTLRSSVKGRCLKEISERFNRVEEARSEDVFGGNPEPAIGHHG